MVCKPLASVTIKVAVLNLMLYLFLKLKIKVAVLMMFKGELSIFTKVLMLYWFPVLVCKYNYGTVCIVSNNTIPSRMTLCNKQQYI